MAKTLNMIKTTFPMRGNLVEKDKIYLDNYKKFTKHDLIFNKKGEKKFLLHGGPPYSNGDIHLGHALNKILKDFFVRFHSHLGYDVTWNFGFDNHGLPIELIVQKQFPNLRTQNPKKYLEECEKFSLAQVKSQIKQFEKLNLSADFTKSYLTMSPSYISSEYDVLSLFHKENRIYRKLRPILWSYSSNTALAKNEVIYKNINTKSLFVNFKLSKKSSVKLNLNNITYLVIWTTTPWTLLANKAVAYSNNIKYVVYKDKLTNLYYIFSKESSKLLVNENRNFIFIKEIDGKEINDIELISPLTNERIKTYNADFVTSSEGSGFVHIAPGHGEDDYFLSLKNNIEIRNILDDKCNIDFPETEFHGQFYQEINTKIFEKLEKQSQIFSTKMIEHSYPFDWRTKKPLVYRSTEQWFINLDNLSSNINLDKINFSNSTDKSKLDKILNERDHDWCISRQRTWGVNIFLPFDENSKPVNSIEDSFFADIKNIVINNKRSFWKQKLEEIYPMYQFKDEIIDVWFDSGISNIVVLKKEEKASLFLEGKDQFRGWFNSSLITSQIYRKDTPFKNLFTHGFVLDKNKNKMSKSAGNVTSPFEIIDKYGTDVLKLWVALSSVKNDVILSDDTIEHSVNTYRRVRNVIRYCIGSLHDFNPRKDMIDFRDNEELLDVYTKYAKVHNNLINDMKKCSYFDMSFKDVINFFISFFSNTFLENSKQIMYNTVSGDVKRQEIQTIIYVILYNIIKLLNAFMPVTADEAYRHLTDGKEILKSKLTKIDEFEK